MSEPKKYRLLSTVWHVNPSTLPESDWNNLSVPEGSTESVICYCKGFMEAHKLLIERKEEWDRVYGSHKVDSSNSDCTVVVEDGRVFRYSIQDIADGNIYKIYKVPVNAIWRKRECVYITDSWDGAWFVFSNMGERLDKSDKVYVSKRFRWATNEPSDFIVKESNGSYWLYTLEEEDVV